MKKLAFTRPAFFVEVLLSDFNSIGFALVNNRFAHTVIGWSSYLIEGNKSDILVSIRFN